MPIPQEPPSDDQLVADVLRGELDAFATLMRRHNRSVYRAVRSILRDEAEIEEVMQQSYLLAFSHLRGFRGAAKVSTWMVRIALNEAMATSRRARDKERLVARPTPSTEDPMSKLPSRDPSPEERAEQRELTRLLEDVVDALPEIYKSVLILREIDGMSTAEAAVALSVTEEVVKTRLSRAKHQVRAEVMGRLGEVREACFAFHATRCERVIRAVLDRLGAPA